MSIHQANLKSIVRGVYDIQKLRISMGNRIVGNFRARLGQKPGEKMDAKDKRLLDVIAAEYKRVTDGVARVPRSVKLKLEGQEVISDQTEVALIEQYLALEANESGQFRLLGRVVADHPLWPAFLDGVKGVGPAIAGVILSEIDISKARYPSSLWAYAGLDVAGDGRGRSRKKEHLVERDYTDKEGKPAKRVGITFNPFLKTKLVGVLGDQFNRRPDTLYGGILREYKHRLESHPKYGLDTETSKGHRQNMAVRYAVKRFLVDLYRAWRPLEGLAVAPEYNEAKLGHEHAA